MRPTEDLLSKRIGMSEIMRMTSWIDLNLGYRETMLEFSQSSDLRIATNSLWILTHLNKSHLTWFTSQQNRIIGYLLSEKNCSKKRLYLQLLKEQDYKEDNEMIIRLLDYCLLKINSETEPYAVRCFSIYVCLRICRNYPELILELEEHIELLTMQSLSPGLKSALRKARKTINKLT